MTSEEDAFWDYWKEQWAGIRCDKDGVGHWKTEGYSEDELGKACYLAGHASRDHEVAELKRRYDLQEKYTKRCEKNLYEASCHGVDLYKQVEALKGAIVKMDTALDYKAFRGDCDLAMKIVDDIERKRSLPRADLLRPSDDAFERQVKRALIILSKWGDDAPADQKVEMAREILQKALASLPRADSPVDNWCGWCKGRGERMLVSTGAIGKCPDCDGSGAYKEKCPECDSGRISQIGTWIGKDCPNCHGTGIKEKV